jgi:hypothetical protein
MNTIWEGQRDPRALGKAARKGSGMNRVLKRGPDKWRMKKRSKKF